MEPHSYQMDPQNDPQIKFYAIELDLGTSEGVVQIPKVTKCNPKVTKWTPKVLPKSNFMA